MSQVQMKFDAKTKLYSLTGLPQGDDAIDDDLGTLIGDFEAESILGCLNHSLSINELTEQDGQTIAALFNAEESPQEGCDAVLSWMNENHADLMAGPAGNGLGDDDSDDDY